MAKINKIIGTSGPDSLEGTSGSDSIEALAGEDTIVAKQGGDGFLNAGANDDVIGMGAQLTSADTIEGGEGHDILYFSDANKASDDLDNVRNVEHIVLGDAATNITARYSLVAAGSTLDIDGSRLTNSMTFNGAAVVVGSFNITAGKGNDVITGGSLNDTLIGKLGGNDTILAGNGDDVIGMGRHMTAADKIDGGAGTDTLWLKDDDSAATTLDQVTNVEIINFADVQTNVTTVDGLVASGKTLSVDASRILTSTLTWNGAAESNGHFNIQGGANADTITGGSQADTIIGGSGDDIIAGSGGSDCLKGRDGDDIFNVGTHLNKNATVNGGDGNDTLNYQGSATAATSDLNRVQNVETIAFVDGASVSLKSVDSNVYAGQTLTVDGSGLTGTNSLTWDGSAETDGNFVIRGGKAGDAITAGQGADSIDGGDGDDTFSFKTYLQSDDTVIGGNGSDTLKFTDNGKGDSELRNVSGVEKIELGNAATDVRIWDDNVAAGQLLAIGANVGTSASLTHIGGSVVIDGSAETDGRLAIYGGRNADTITGGAQNDTIETGTGNDTIVARFGGNDSVDAGAGNDTIGFGKTLDQNDTVVGGAGNDTLWFTDDTWSGARQEIFASEYGTWFAANTPELYKLRNMRGIENIKLGDADTAIAFGDFPVLEVAGTLTVDGSAITAKNSLSFSAYTPGGGASMGYAGGLVVTGGAGDDCIYTGSGASTVNGGAGNDLIVNQGSIPGDSHLLHGGAGDDTILLAINGGAIESLDGGEGTDTVKLLKEDHQGLRVDSFVNIENIEIINLGSAAKTTVAASLVSGKTLNVSGGTLGVKGVGTTAATIDASGLTIADGAGCVLEGTDLADTIKSVASGDCQIFGNGGADTIALGGGKDSLMYSAPTDGGATGDVISSFVSADDGIFVKDSLVSVFKVIGSVATPASLEIGSNGIGFLFDTNNTGDKAVTSANLANLGKVADQLNAAFSFTAPHGLTYSTVFAVEAGDKPGNFGVYVWKQENSSDATVEAAELKILGIVTGDDLTVNDVSVKVGWV